MTFSVVGRCARTGSFGVAISSSSPAVAARCAHVRAGVGASSTQNVTDPRLGPAVLDLLGDGASAREAVGAVAVAAGEHGEYRQLSAVDSSGLAHAWSGRHALGRSGHLTADDVAVAGNLLASDDVLPAMLDVFTSRPGAELPERLLSALEAGLGAGGEEGPVRSAGLVVVTDVPWPTTDLRVDWSDDPVGVLRALWEVWRPQAHDYVVRALDPTAAPSFGVPGDT